MSTNIPYPNLKDGDDFSVTPLMANILALLLAVQSFDGSQVQAGTIPAAALATGLNPLARDYDIFPSFVASGLLPSGYTGLTLTIPNGVAYVNYNSALTKYVVSGGSYTVGTSKDTYFSLNNAGVVDTPIALANGAALPSLATGSQFLFRAVSDGTGITRIDDLRASSFGGPFTPFTPTFTGLTLGSGTLTARYLKVGKRVNFWINLVWGAGTAITAPAPTFTLPVPATASYPANSMTITKIGTSDLLRQGVAQYPGFVSLVSTTTAKFEVLATGGSNIVVNDITATSPATWASTDIFTASGSYEAA